MNKTTWKLRENKKNRSTCYLNTWVLQVKTHR